MLTLMVAVVWMESSPYLAWMPVELLRFIASRLQGSNDGQ